MSYYRQHSDGSRRADLRHPAPSGLAAFVAHGGAVGCGGRALSLDLFDKAS